jgi:DNA adenine methylase
LVTRAGDFPEGGVIRQPKNVRFDYGEWESAAVVLPQRKPTITIRRDFAHVSRGLRLGVSVSYTAEVTASAIPLFLLVSRSPLRYPGGKSRAAKVIVDLIPANVDELMSPFFGGGSVELACAERGINVYGYDIFKPLVAFWSLLLNNPEHLARKVQQYFPLSKKEFYELQKQHKDEETELQGILFFVLNRASFSGTTLSGGCSEESVQQRFTQSSIDRLLAFNTPGFSVHWADFNDAMQKHPDTFMYLDPPYMIQSTLYGHRGSTHRGFDHVGLCEQLKSRKGWILSYNNCEQIVELYKDFEIIYPDWKYGMSKNKLSKEVLITNF